MIRYGLTSLGDQRSEKSFLIQQTNNRIVHLDKSSNFMEKFIVHAVKQVNSFEKQQRSEQERKSSY